MVRSSVRAFYPRLGCHFYWIGKFRSGKFNIVFIRPSVLCEFKKIVDRVSEILFAAEVAFRRLNRGVAQQELNLLQFTAANRGRASRRSAAGRAVQCAPSLLSRSTF
jgi:hypothetical protein